MVYTFLMSKRTLCENEGKLNKIAQVLLEGSGEREHDGSNAESEMRFQL